MHKNVHVKASCVIQDLELHVDDICEGNPSMGAAQAVRKGERNVKATIQKVASNLFVWCCFFW